MDKNLSVNPMDRRCGAKTRSGRPCRNTPMPNGRCYYHGGPSTGAPKGNRNAWKHGNRSSEAEALRRMLRSMRASLRGEEMAVP